MSHDHNDDVIPDSTYPPLDAPAEFKSQIPAPLLVGASPIESYMLEQMSILRQYNDWKVNALVETHAYVRRTNGRLIRAEEDIKGLKGDRKSVKVGWKVIGWIVGAIVTVASLAASIYEALHSGGG